MKMEKEENIETESELRENVKNKDWRMRGYVAGNEDTPVEVLGKLAKDEDECVRIKAHKKILQQQYTEMKDIIVKEREEFENV